MGCESAKEKIETQMMTLKLERADIMAEREDKLKELEKITGETVIRPEVPDYIAKNQKWSHSRQNTEETDEHNNMVIFF